MPLRIASSTRSRIAEQRLPRAGGDERVAGHLGEAEHSHEPDVDQHVDEDHQQHAHHHRAWNAPARIANLLAKVERAGPAVVGVDHGLERQHDRGDQGRAGRQGRGHAADRGGGEHQGGGDQRAEGQALDRAQHLLEEVSDPDPAPEHQAEQQHQRDTRGRAVPVERGHQRLEVLGEDHATERDRPAGRDPVAPADDESGILAQAAPHEWVLPPRPGDHRPRLRQRNGAEQRVQASQRPGADEERLAGQARRHLPGGSEDADDDGVADEDRDAEGDAQNLQQLAVPGGGDDLRRGDRLDHFFWNRHR
jgi:hypothetical protein